MNTTLSTVSEKHHSKPCGFTQRARINAPPCYLFILRVTSYMGMLGNIMSLVTIESLQWQLFQVVDQGLHFVLLIQSTNTCSSHHVLDQAPTCALQFVKKVSAALGATYGHHPAQFMVPKTHSELTSMTRKFSLDESPFFIFQM